MFRQMIKAKQRGGESKYVHSCRITFNKYEHVRISRGRLYKKVIKINYD